MPNKRDQKPSNFPALAYLTRVSTAWNELLIDQTAAAQELWDEVKSGNFDAKNVAKLWANGMEGYYDVLTEAVRTEGESSRTVWLHFPYSKKAGGPAEHPVVLSRQQPDGLNLEGTHFTNMLTGKAILLPPFANLELIGKRKLLVRVNPAVLQKATAGEYTSVVAPTNRGPGQPLVIVVLVVSD